MIDHGTKIKCHNRMKNKKEVERKSKELPIDESKFKGLHQNKSWMASIHIFLHILMMNSGEFSDCSHLSPLHYFTLGLPKLVTIDCNRHI